MAILGLYIDNVISKSSESRLLSEAAYHTLLENTNGCMFVWVAGKELK